MVHTLDVDQFINMAGRKNYENLISRSIKDMTNMKEHNSGKPQFFFTIYHASNKEGEKVIGVEAVSRPIVQAPLGGGDIMVSAATFEVVRIYVGNAADEPELLKRYEELNEMKEEKRQSREN